MKLLLTFALSYLLMAPAVAATIGIAERTVKLTKSEARDVMVFEMIYTPSSLTPG